MAQPGVWVGPEKVAAVGVSSSRWITTHGLALNVDPDLRYFDESVMIPCGIEDKGRGVTSVSQILRNEGVSRGDIPTLAEVAEAIVRNFGKAFEVEVTMGDEIC